MVSIDNVERGIAKYIDRHILPNLPQTGAKGFGIGVAASLLVKRGGNLLREYAKQPILQQMGIITADGAVDLDVIREAAADRMPPQGVTVDLPLGITIRVNAADVDAICNAIREEARV